MWRERQRDPPLRPRPQRQPGPGRDPAPPGPSGLRRENTAGSAPRSRPRRTARRAADRPREQQAAHRDSTATAANHVVGRLGSSPSVARSGSAINSANQERPELTPPLDLRSGPSFPIGQHPFSSDSPSSPLIGYHSGAVPTAVVSPRWGASMFVRHPGRIRRDTGPHHRWDAAIGTMTDNIDPMAGIGIHRYSPAWPSRPSAGRSSPQRSTTAPPGVLHLAVPTPARTYPACVKVPRARAAAPGAARQDRRGNPSPLCRARLPTRGAGPETREPDRWTLFCRRDRGRRHCRARPLRPRTSRPRRVSTVYRLWTDRRGTIGGLPRGPGGGARPRGAGARFSALRLALRATCASSSPAASTDSATASPASRTPSAAVPAER